MRLARRGGRSTTRDACGYLSRVAVKARVMAIQQPVMDSRISWRYAAQRYDDSGVLWKCAHEHRNPLEAQDCAASWLERALVEPPRPKRRRSVSGWSG